MARLGSVMNSLNIGIKTAVEHLTKKGVVRDLNPNSKLSDTEVRILRDAFSKDKDMKVASERISHQRQVKDKPESVAIDGFGKKKAKKTADKPTAEKPVAEKTITPVPSPEKPTVKVVDKIDLDALSKPKAKAQPSKPVAPAPVSPKTPNAETKKQEAPKKEAPKKEEVKTSLPKPEMVKPNVEKASSVEEPKKSAPKTESPKPETKPIKPAVSSPIAKPSNLAPKAIQKETASQVSKPNAPKGNMPQESKMVKPTSKSKMMASTKESPEVEKQPVVTQKTETKIYEPNKAQVTNHITVIGKIDLNAINGSTRPKKKTKEEKNKERRAKLNPTRKTTPAKPGDKSAPGSTATTGVRKKRKRIGGDRVDVSNENTRDNTNRTGTNSTPGSNTTGSRNYSQHSNNDTRGRKRRRAVPAAPVSEEDVARQVKETLARLQAGKRTKKGVKYRKDKRDANAQRQTDQATKDAQEAKVLKLTEFVTANELATMMNVPVTQIIQICFNLGVVVSINQRLDAETINIVAEELGYRTEFVSAEIANAVTEEEDKEEDLVPRSPIVTVMGHVDHGKTSLLDHIRNANVIAGEAGGITQHIGAYNVKLKGGKSITFLDTPGHEAFTAMRARGAQATDIAIIIIAADDDVMPQTKEAINHATAAGVPIIFAINKIDKPHANPDRIKQSLSTLNYAVEEWGGKYQSQDISAKSGLGVHDLLEKVLLEAEMLDLKANPNRKAVGTIIESSLDKGRGYVATLLVKTGTLRQGDVVVAGTAFGRIKAMFNERNQRIESAGPSEPAIILGLNGAPQAGDLFNIFENEHEAREIANKREQLAREQSIRTTSHLTLEEIGRRIALGSFQELNVIVKGDVDGSIEALSDSLIKLSTPEIQVNVIHKGVGQISETDIMLAAASNAIIIGFQVRPSVEARRAAEKEEVDIRLYSVIYDAIEQLKDAMEGMLSPDIKEEVNANLEIRQTFKITKVGTIAGCIVKDGKISRHDKVRIIRDGIVQFTGVLASLKREKDDVKDVGMGFECGLNIQGYNDIQEGDLIEAYKEIEVKKKL